MATAMRTVPVKASPWRSAGPVGPSFLSGPSGPNEPSVRPRGAERGGPYPLKPRILGSNTMTRLLEAGPLPALLFEPTSGRVGLDRVQYARPNGSVRQ